MTVTLVSSSRMGREPAAVELWVLDALSPITQSTHGLMQSVREAFDRLIRLSQLYEENQELRRQVAELQREASAASRLEADYERLRRLLELKSLLPETVTAANVIGRNPDHWLKMVIIDAGARDGVTEDMVVVEPRGVVGRIIRVSERTATVLLLTDPQSGIGIITARSRDAGVATGQAGTTLMAARFFGRSPDVEVGDRVVTSGYGGIFPPGLDVGKVARVDRDSQGLVVTAQIEPAVDFDRLAEVLVLRVEPLPVEVTTWEAIK